MYGGEKKDKGVVLNSLHLVLVERRQFQEHRVIEELPNQGRIHLVESGQHGLDCRQLISLEPNRAAGVFRKKDVVVTELEVGRFELADLLCDDSHPVVTGHIRGYVGHCGDELGALLDLLRA